MVTIFKNFRFIVEILSFLKEVSSVFEKCQFLLALFFFGKESHFMQKVLVFGRMSDKIMLCKLCGKVNSVFFNINFAAKVCFRQNKKKKKKFGINVDFSSSAH